MKILIGILAVAGLFAGCFAILTIGAIFTRAVEDLRKPLKRNSHDSDRTKRPSGAKPTTD